MMMSYMFLIMMNNFSMIYFFLTKNSYLFLFNLFSNSSMEIQMNFLLDDYSLMFSTIVSMISFSISMFSSFYMGENTSKKFTFLMVSFVMSMQMIIFSGNFFSLMVGWDMLGVISFMLIFFYSNETSKQNSMITMCFNRTGDFFFIMLMSTFFGKNFDFSSISSFFLYNSMLISNLTKSFNENFSMFMFMLILTAISKSAQYPFNSWLPLAMSAPTPISALVHSSTLVTAGIFLLIRISNCFGLNEISQFSMWMGMLTMIMGGMMALKETDFKKMIAFSTLSQMGILFLILSTSFKENCFFHLITHAIFKSCLFMMSGISMMYFFGNQEIRSFSIPMFCNIQAMMMTILCCMNLMGFPLSMGFLSKDTMIELILFNKNNLLFSISFLMGCSITVAYSIKIIMSIYKNFNMGETLMPQIKIKKNFLMLLSSYIMMSFSGIFLEESISSLGLFCDNYNMKIMDMLIILIGMLTYIYNKNSKKMNNKWKMKSQFKISTEMFMNFKTITSASNMFNKKLISTFNTIDFNLINPMINKMYKITFSKKML